MYLTVAGAIDSPGLESFPCEALSNGLVGEPLGAKLLSSLEHLEAIAIGIWG
jgi:hypothetical protein